MAGVGDTCLLACLPCLCHALLPAWLPACPPCLPGVHFRPSQLECLPPLCCPARPILLCYSQWEYDDEYDDSFDDLIAYGADGVTEMEGDAVPAAAQRGGGPSGPAPQQLQAAALTFQPGRPAPQAGQQARGPKAKGAKLWVLDGRIYNYPKPGGGCRLSKGGHRGRGSMDGGGAG